MTTEELEHVFIKLDNDWNSSVVPTYQKLKEKLSLLNAGDEEPYQQIKKELIKIYECYYVRIMQEFRDKKLTLPQQHRLYHYTFTMRQNLKADLTKFDTLFANLKNKPAALSPQPDTPFTMPFTETQHESWELFAEKELPPLNNPIFTTKPGFTFFGAEDPPSTLTEEELEAQTQIYLNDSELANFFQ